MVFLVYAGTGLAEKELQYDSMPAIESSSDLAKLPSLGSTDSTFHSLDLFRRVAKEK